MKVFVYCAHSWRLSTALATLKVPKTCPPERPATLKRAWFEDADVIYLRLHGLPNQSFLYGDGLITALAASQIRQLDLGGKIVFMEGCFGESGRVDDAFLAAGAKFVIGSTMATKGRRYRLGPSTLIGGAWLRYVKRGIDPRAALHLAEKKHPTKLADFKVIGANVDG